MTKHISDYEKLATLSIKCFHDCNAICIDTMVSHLDNNVAE